MVGPVEDVSFERVSFRATTNVGSAGGDGSPGGLVVEETAQAVPRVKRVRVSESRFESSGVGLNLLACEDCSVTGSHFVAPGEAGKEDGYYLARKENGAAVRFLDNTFDLANGDAPGLLLRFLTSSSAPGEYAQVIGNSFINQPDGTTALRLYGYSNAIISGNLFRCSDCLARAIWLTHGACVGGCNRTNAITSNLFEGFQDNDANRCAIHIPPTVAADPSGNAYNLIGDNVFLLGAGSAAGTDGVCGDETQIGMNVLGTNVLVSP